MKDNFRCPDDLYVDVEGVLGVRPQKSAQNFDPLSQETQTGYKNVLHRAHISCKNQLWSSVRNGGQPIRYRLAWNYLDNNEPVAFIDMVEIRRMNFVHKDGTPYDIRPLEAKFLRTQIDKLPESRAQQVIEMAYYSLHDHPPSEQWVKDNNVDVVLTKHVPIWDIAATNVHHLFHGMKWTDSSRYDATDNLLAFLNTKEGDETFVRVRIIHPDTLALVNRAGLSSGLTGIYYVLAKPEQLEKLRREMIKTQGMKVKKALK